MWLDEDGDGLQGELEPGVGGVEVSLLSDQDALLQTTTTEADGSYSFVTEPGSYILELVAPGSAFTVRDAGSDDGIDSDVDPATGRTPLISLGSGQVDLTWDAGLLTEATVGDRVWLDEDADGLQDSGEPGLAGVTVRRLSDQGVLLETVTTDADGFYSLVTGAESFVLEVVAPSGFLFTHQDVGNDDGIDSDVAPMLGGDGELTGLTPLISLGPGEVDLDWDAGLVGQALGDRVWIDSSGDGLQSPGESGLAGVTVTILDEAGTPLSTVSTDIGGHYFFYGIATGTYRLEITSPQGFVFSPHDQGGDDTMDCDFDGTGHTPLFVYTGESIDSSWDGGFIPLPLFADGFESGDTGAWSSEMP